MCDDRIQKFEQKCSESEPKDLTDYSQENCIEWIRGQKTVTVTLANGTALCNKVKQFSEEYPEEVKITYVNGNGSIVAHLPLKYIRISRPVERNLTDEQREQLRERFRKVRQKSE